MADRWSARGSGFVRIDGSPGGFLSSEGFVASVSVTAPLIGVSVPLETVVEAMLGLLVVGGLVVPVPERLVLLGLLLVRRLLVVLLVVLGAVVALLVVLATVVGLLTMGTLVAVLEVTACLEIGVSDQ